MSIKIRISKKPILKENITESLNLSIPNEEEIEKAILKTGMPYDIFNNPQKKLLEHIKLFGELIAMAFEAWPSNVPKEISKALRVSFGLGAGRTIVYQQNRLFGNNGGKFEGEVSVEFFIGETEEWKLKHTPNIKVQYLDEFLSAGWTWFQPGPPFTRWLNGPKWIYQNFGQ